MRPHLVLCWGFELLLHQHVLQAQLELHKTRNLLFDTFGQAHIVGIELFGRIALVLVYVEWVEAIDRIVERCERVAPIDTHLGAEKIVNVPIAGLRARIEGAADLLATRNLGR